MARMYWNIPDITLRRCITSFFGFLDIKVGAQIITLFSLLNKIAGAYGILAIFLGGTFSQLSLYVYSIATIPVFLWGMKSISEEQPVKVTRYGHIFLLDHLVSTFWTLLFGVWWFLYTNHDGKPPSASSHQANLVSLIESLEAQYMTPEQLAPLRHKDLNPKTPEGAREIEWRRQQANMMWASEESFSLAVLVIGWLVKIYFALTIYSYASHLKHDTYWKLPLSNSASAHAHLQYEALEGDIEDAEPNDGIQRPHIENGRVSYSLGP